nr:MAG TPA: hypothetical protein [Bacteriophage sp.]
MLQHILYTLYMPQYSCSIWCHKQFHTFLI